MRFLKKEWKGIIIASIILGFVFSFREWGPGSTPNISTGIANWIASFILVMIAYSLHNLAHKIIAAKHCAKSEFDLWRFNMKFFKPNSKPYLISIGPILAVVFALFSNGTIKFSALESQNIKSNIKERIGKKFKHIREIEIAYIALAGPIMSLFLALFFSIFNNPIFDKFILINISIAIYSMIPIHNLDGSRIWIGSYFVYIFSVILIIACTALINIMNVVGYILLSVLTLSILIILAKIKT